MMSLGLWTMPHAIFSLRKKSAGEFLRAHLTEIRQTGECDGLFHEFSSFLFVSDIESAEIIDVFIDGHLLKDGNVLHDNTDILLDIVAVRLHILSKDRDRSFVIF